MRWFARLGVERCAVLCWPQMDMEMARRALDGGYDSDKERDDAAAHLVDAPQAGGDAEPNYEEEARLAAMVSEGEAGREGAARGVDEGWGWHGGAGL